MIAIGGGVADVNSLGCGRTTVCGIVGINEILIAVAVEVAPRTVKGARADDSATSGNIESFDRCYFGKGPGVCDSAVIAVQLVIDAGAGQVVVKIEVEITVIVV